MAVKLYSEAESFGARGWWLQGVNVELFLTEQGGQHAPGNFRLANGACIQPYYLSPWQERKPDLSSIPLLQYLRGDFFCLPFGGNAEAVDGHQYQCHGETSACEWRFAAAHRESASTVFEFTQEGKVLPTKVTKRIELKDGQSALYLQHTVTGLEGKMPYGHHAILKLPSANEKMYFSCGKFDLGMTPTSLFSDPANWEYQFLASGEEFASLEALPTLFKQPATWDYSVYPSPVGYTDLFALLKKPSATPAWAVASYADAGYLYYSLKNAAELPSTTIWVANSGRYEEPWNGISSNFAIEETCSYFADGWKPSIEENALTRKGWRTCGEFHAAEPKTVRLIQGVAAIPDGFTKVAAADFQPGKVVFTDVNGLSATATVDWEFLGC
ncbi:MAG: hypothetical protein J5654_08590 [Victivallales bacterium]|nr:hypothetical protein [Victivallales bacterium]